MTKGLILAACLTAVHADNMVLARRLNRMQEARGIPSPRMQKLHAECVAAGYQPRSCPPAMKCQMKQGVMVRASRGTDDHLHDAVIRPADASFVAVCWIYFQHPMWYL